jgi:hypothetical protein
MQTSMERLAPELRRQVAVAIIALRGQRAPRLT